MALTEEVSTQIRQDFKRCGDDVVDAIISYRESRDSALVPGIVVGIIGRYMPPSSIELSSASDDLKLVEDLGIDSLTMLEAVLSIEEALEVRIDNEELRNIQTLGDVKKFSVAKSKGEAVVSQPKVSGSLSATEIEQLLPQGKPFVFIDSAEVSDAKIEAVFQTQPGAFYFQGHFKDTPILPGAILSEAMGQAACLYIKKAENKAGTDGHIYVLNIEGAHFRRTVKPGDKLEITMQLHHAGAPLYQFTGEAKVGSETVVHLEKILLVHGEMQQEA